MGGLGLSDSALLGRTVIPTDGGRIGGLSGVHIADDGLSFTAISDRGTFLTGQFTRNGFGKITGISAGPSTPIRSVALQAANIGLDSEGLAIAPDGTIYVSFEGETRIGKFTSLDANEITLPVHPDFATLQNNSGLEALAIDADGALLTIPERSGRYDEPFPVYRFADGKWDEPYAIPRTGSYLIVGADFGPDGLLYVLERDFTGFGFHTRVRRLDLGAATAETVLETGIGVHGNMEGISVWQQLDGQIVMTLMADNNFMNILTNEIAEYRLDG